MHQRPGEGGASHFGQTRSSGHDPSSVRPLRPASGGAVGHDVGHVRLAPGGHEPRRAPPGPPPTRSRARLHRDAPAPRRGSWPRRGPRSAARGGARRAPSRPRRAASASAPRRRRRPHVPRTRQSDQPLDAHLGARPHRVVGRHVADARARGPRHGTHGITATGTSLGPGRRRRARQAPPTTSRIAQPRRQPHDLRRRPPGQDARVDGPTGLPFPPGSRVGRPSSRRAGARSQGDLHRGVHDARRGGPPGEGGAEPSVEHRASGREPPTTGRRGSHRVPPAPRSRSGVPPPAAPPARPPPPSGPHRPESPTLPRAPSPPRAPPATGPRAVVAASAPAG